jgi:DNA-binding response OmpR family regulator
MSSLNIFVVEVHDVMREALVMALRRMGHTVASARALDDTLHVVSSDILLLTVAGAEALSHVRRIRAAQPAIGIIVITPGPAGDELVSAYQSGADMVLSKPASPDEMCAAVRALERRMHPLAPSAWQCTLNTATLQLQGPETTVNVSDAECLLLAAFAQSVEQRLNNEQMIGIAAKGGAAVSKTTLEVQIVRLRKKLEQAGALAPNIKSIRGVGYQLCVPLVVSKTFKSPHHA